MKNMQEMTALNQNGGGGQQFGTNMPASNPGAFATNSMMGGGIGSMPSMMMGQQP
jgi:hypothetical protein